jgi:hypothetical protein
MINRCIDYCGRKVNGEKYEENLLVKKPPFLRSEMFYIII